MKRKVYPDATLARNIKKILAEKNMTQRRLAEIVGKERKTINAWVNCLSSPSATEIKIICLEFRISADELLGLKGEK